MDWACSAIRPGIGETAWFRKLEGEYHYMGESHGAGDLVRLVFEEDGAPVALMTWAAACYCLKARDERIGWNPAMRARRGRATARRGGRRSACPGARTAMLAGCPEGSPCHGRRASRALAGRDCGQGTLSRIPQAGRARVFQRNVRLEKERNSLPNENTVPPPGSSSRTCTL